jgi:hypothetical protein
MDYEELFTLWAIINVVGGVDEVAKELNIKPSSLKRQMNRIEAFVKGRKGQKRSGIRRGEDYLNAMRKVAERRVGQPVLTQFINTPRIVQFNNLWDLLRYRQPISHISSIRYFKGEDIPWHLYIAINSAVI